jgi:hypothetical protein
MTKPLKVSRVNGRVEWPPGVAAAIYCGHVPVEISYPCKGCDDPTHVAMRFLDDERGMSGFGGHPSEFRDPSPLALEIFWLALRESAKGR